MPLQRRLPKRGFTNIFRVDYQEVNIAALEKLGSPEITPGHLAEKGIVKGKNKLIKILGSGEVTRAMTVKAHAFSRSAVEKIEKAGGKVEIIGGSKKTGKRSSAPAPESPQPNDGNIQPDVQAESPGTKDPGAGEADNGDQE
jgi:hypothetical protein